MMIACGDRATAASVQALTIPLLVFITEIS